MRRIRVSVLAERDLEEIWYYIARNSGRIDIATSVIETITEAFALLARMPEAGAPRDEIEPGTRGFPVGKYIIYYRAGSGHVQVARVIHGMRDQERAYFED